MPTVAVRALSMACGLAIAAAAAGDGPFYADVTAARLPAGLAGPCMDASAGDADGDGDLDLVLAMEFQRNVLLLNDGRALFSDASDRLPDAMHDSEDVAFADFDGDGDLDLVFVSEDDRKDELYLNDGSGRFVDASDRLRTHETSNALAVLDLNGDGAPDLLIGNIGRDFAMINDGRGRFRDETAERWPQGDDPSRTQDIELADVDGDGDLDVLVGNEGQNQLYLNRDGRLVDATATSLPTRADETREIRAADVDGDGDLDMLVANVRFVMGESPRDYLLINDGSGVFTTADAARFPEDGRSNFTVQAVDLDRDGDLDVLLPSTVFPRIRNDVLLFVTDGAKRASVVHGTWFDTKDVDGDGDLDAIVGDGDLDSGGTPARTRTFINENGRFVVSKGGEPPSATSLEDVDVDGDGAPDLAAQRIDLAELSDSPREDDFAAAAAIAPVRTDTVQTADLDRDGDVDVVISTSLSMVSAGDMLVLVNDGAGRFTRAAAGAILPQSANGNGFDVEVADFDADGVEDLFLCNRASLPEADAAARTGGQQRLLLGVGR